MKVKVCVGPGQLILDLYNGGGAAIILKTPHYLIISKKVRG